MRRRWLLFMLPLIWLGGTWAIIYGGKYLTPAQIWLLSLLFLILCVLYIHFRNWWSLRILSFSSRQPRVFRQFVNELVNLKNTGRLCNQSIFLLRAALRTHRVDILTKKCEKGTYCCWNESGCHENIPESVARLFAWFRVNSDIIVRKHILRDVRYEAIREELRQACESLQAEVLVPLVQEESLLGLISVGRRDDGKSFGGYELMFLERLRPIFTIALHNSYLYGYVGNLSRELWEANQHLDRKVRDRTHALERALSQMRKLNEEQNNFFTMASHNLVTPLTAIKASLMLMLGRRPQLDVQLQGILQENLQRLETLVQGMLDISLIESNRLNLYYEIIDIPMLIREAHLQAASLYNLREVTWTTDLPIGITTLYGDKARLRMVLFHLLSNAYKYAGERAHVHLRLKLAALETFACYNGWSPEPGDSGPYVEFAISDNGVGIPEEECRTIFNKFYQVNSSSKRYQGNGLGLHLTKKILEYHGGAIRVESRLGEGSTFYFILPIDFRVAKPENHDPAKTGA